MLNLYVWCSYTKSEKKLLECIAGDRMCVLVKWRYFMHFIINRESERRTGGSTRSKIETAIARFIAVAHFTNYVYWIVFGPMRSRLPLFSRLTLYRTPKSRADFHKYRHLLFSRQIHANCWSFLWLFLFVSLPLSLSLHCSCGTAFVLLSTFALVSDLLLLSETHRGAKKR